MLYFYLLLLVVYSLKSTLGWDVPSSNQYHIQTDEGPERYFRYQTDSGQYRKEKRLEDGTVVGTYAWIDDNGFLRQRDYIADDAGYRILKNKNVFVGRNVAVGQAVKLAAKSGFSPSAVFSSNKQSVVNTPYNTVPSYQSTPLSSIVHSSIGSSTTVRPYSENDLNEIVSSTPSGIITSTVSPLVEITPNSVYSTSIYPLLLSSRNSTSGIINDNYISPTSIPSQYSSLTPSYYQLPSPSEKQHQSNPSLQYIPSTEKPYGAGRQTFISYNDVPKAMNENSLEYNPYINQVDNSYRFHNGPTYPLGTDGKLYFGQNLRNQYDPQYSTYDGISVTNDGFRYYIPRAYHEEQTLPGDKRSGSFGYIDPFGIRRVIYYNTAPGTGFEHRKNNRYVGFQATPYDPRPY